MYERDSGAAVHDERVIARGRVEHRDGVVDLTKISFAFDNIDQLSEKLFGYCVIFDDHQSFWGCDLLKPYRGHHVDGGP